MYQNLLGMLLPFLSVCCYMWDGASAYVMMTKSNSNAIKNVPAAPVLPPVSVSPDSFYDLANKYQPLETVPFYGCADDDDCTLDEFCHGSRSGNSMVCLACRKRRKRCMRDSMCCMGNYCNNGICVSLEHDNERIQHPGYMDESLIDNYNPEHGTVDTHTKLTTSPAGMQPFKGNDGDVCLRSSDCSPGLCCARHFWSKICKPVLEEGQVCTKHRRKGSHGLEIFQRCHCGAGLTCKLQKAEFTTVPKTSRLHTCQRH